MIRIEAAQRLTAAKASVNAALEFLTEIGFQGLKLKATQNDLIKFWYKGYSKKTVEQHLGKPKTTEPSIRYDFGKAGVVAIWPNNMTVVLKNIGGNQAPAKPKLPESVPESKPEHEPDGKAPNVPGSKTNDDSKVPIVHISPELEKQYAQIKGIRSPLAQMMFFKELWIFLNTHKFAGRMRMPVLNLMKDMGERSMRARGRWWAHNRKLEVSPRMFNGSQEFFVETVLHEMCHQAVSEIDRTIETDEQGHGPIWRRWMRHVGLNPLRYDPNDNSVYTSDRERKQQEDAKKERERLEQEALKKAQDQGLVHMKAPTKGSPATVLSKGRVLHGMLIYPWYSKGHPLWAFLPETTVLLYQNGQKTISWVNVSPKDVYEYNGRNLEHHKKPIWDALSRAIINTLIGRGH